MLCLKSFLERKFKNNIVLKICNTSILNTAKEIVSTCQSVYSLNSKIFIIFNREFFLLVNIKLNLYFIYIIVVK
jgi:hypothetical protein